MKLHCDSWFSIRFTLIKYSKSFIKNDTHGDKNSSVQKSKINHNLCISTNIWGFLRIVNETLLAELYHITSWKSKTKWTVG